MIFERTHICTVRFNRQMKYGCRQRLFVGRTRKKSKTSTSKRRKWVDVCGVYTRKSERYRMGIRWFYHPRSLDGLLSRQISRDFPLVFFSGASDWYNQRFCGYTSPNQDILEQLSRQLTWGLKKTYRDP